jgi:cytoskeletal protein CcmA (bactofilin family)
MWKREDAPERVEPRVDRPVNPEQRPAAAQQRREQATIGPSITIRGDVTGDEDLLIQGRIEGSVQLDQHSVTVGEQGEVSANISARTVTVEGTVEGNLRAHEQVVLRGSARVMGDVVAPRVVLEDGAYFRGGIDMGEPGDRARPANRRASGTPAAAGAQSTGKTPATPAQAPAQIAIDA